MKDTPPVLHKAYVLTRPLCRRHNASVIRYQSAKGKPSESWGRKVTGLRGRGPYDSGIAGLGRWGDVDALPVR